MSSSVPAAKRFVPLYAVGHRALLSINSVLEEGALRRCTILSVLPGEDHHVKATYRVHCDNEPFDRVVNEDVLTLPN